MPSAYEPSPTVVAASPNHRRGAAIVVKQEMGGESSLVMKQVLAFSSREIPDPFDGLYGQARNGTATSGQNGISIQFDIIEPPYPFSELLKLVPTNNTLMPCIGAMVTNCESFGYELEYIGKPEDKDSPDSRQEAIWIKNLVDHPNPEETMTTTREKMRQDLESIGNAVWEVIRDQGGNVAYIKHLPGHTCRLTKQDAEFTEVTVFLKRDIDQYLPLTMKKRFRRIVQSSGIDKVYFKEFGDPRRVSIKDGRAGDNVPDNELATEIIWFSIYVTGELYGLPRWISQLPSIIGSRESEMTNLDFFQSNAIPALAVLVAGGYLTEETVQAIKDGFQKYRGRAAQNRVLIVEAQGSPDLASVEGSTPVPKLDMKPMTQDRQGDALFQNYDENNQVKIRSSFRLPPLLIGRSDDYTRATAEASLKMAETQVFGPERMKLDDLFNSRILLRKGIPPKYWKMKSNPSKVVGDEVAVNAIEQFNKSGAMTPNLALKLMNEMLNMQAPRIEEPWGDLPMEIVMELAKAGQLELPTYSKITPVVAAGAAPLGAKPNEQPPQKVVPAAKTPTKKDDLQPGAIAENGVRIRRRLTTMQSMESLA